jgi:hypothetical protein|tara:strand:+ start:1401 stop:1586 length:186 start_codon:yes stop_codon:yes gene_type:complete
MNKTELKCELDAVYSELVSLTDTANELKQFAAKLSKSIYEVNKKIDNLGLPQKITQKKKNS